MFQTFFQTKALTPFLLISLMASLGICFGIDQIIVELSLREGPGSGQVIARLDERQSDVRRKRSNHYSWSSVEAGDFFYHRESLQTGDRSRAKLSFPSAPGKKVEISENSIIIFDENAEFGLYLLNGVMTMSDQGSELKIAANFGAESILHNYSAMLISPAAEEELYSRKAVPLEIAFSWRRATKNKSPLVMELAGDANFTKLISKSEVATLEEKKLSLAAGKYFWRLRENKNIVSAVRSLSIAEVDAIPLLSVDSASTNNLFVAWAQPKQTISPNKGAHFLELSEDSEFKVKLMRFPIDPLAGSAMIPKPQLGNYFAKIVSTYGKLSLASQVKSVTITNSKKDIKASPLASSPGGAFSNNLADQNNTARLFGARAPSSEEDTGSSNRNEQIDTTKIAQANTDPTRIQLSSLQQSKNLLLSWTFPQSGTLDHWELWLVDATGNPTTKLIDSIPASWRAYNLDISAVKSGDFYELIGRDTTADVYSEILSYSVSNDPPLAPQNLKLLVLAEQDAAAPTIFGQLALSWDFAGIADGFRVTGDFPNGLQNIINMQLPGNERAAMLNFNFGTEPLLKINIQAFRSNGGNPVFSDTASISFCLGDFNGDGIVDQKDIDLLKANFGTAPAAWSLPPFGGYHSPLDINWDGKIDASDVTVVSTFLGKSCK